ALRRQPLRLALLQRRLERHARGRVLRRPGEGLPRDVLELAVADREAGVDDRRVGRAADDGFRVDGAGELRRTEQEGVDDAEVDAFEFRRQPLAGLSERAVDQKLLLA